MHSMHRYTTCCCTPVGSCHLMLWHEHDMHCGWAYAAAQHHACLVANLCTRLHHHNRCVCKYKYFQMHAQRRICTITHNHSLSHLLLCSHTHCMLLVGSKLHQSWTSQSPASPHTSYPSILTPPYVCGICPHSSSCLRRSFPSLPASQMQRGP